MRSRRLAGRRHRVTIVPSVRRMLSDEGESKVRFDGRAIELTSVVAENFDHASRGPRNTGVAHGRPQSECRLLSPFLQFPRRPEQTVVGELDSPPAVGDDAVRKVPVAVDDDRLPLSLMGSRESNTNHGMIKDAAVSVGKQSRESDTINELSLHTSLSRRCESRLDSEGTMSIYSSSSTFASQVCISSDKSRSEEMGSMI
jgi:hypothetical protein